MLRILMLSGSPGRGNEARRSPPGRRPRGCICDGAADEEGFRRALAHMPDLVIVDEESSAVAPDLALELAKTVLPDMPRLRLTAADQTEERPVVHEIDGAASIQQLGNVVRTQLALARHSDPQKLRSTQRYRPPRSERRCATTPRAQVGAGGVCAST